MGVGGGWVSGKVHSEHIVATRVLMPVGEGGVVSRKVHSEHIVATRVLKPMGGRGWVSGKVHSDYHIEDFQAFTLHEAGPFAFRETLQSHVLKLTHDL